jgi:hypothetical protein
MQMSLTTNTPAQSKPSLWVGRFLSGFAALFLIFDGVIKLFQIAAVQESFTQLGYPVGLALGIGILELICIAVYLIPRTSILGAILLTGYLGGAVATHVRVGSPLFTHRLFPIYIGILIWGGLYLRNRGLRSLIPFHKGALQSSLPSIVGLLMVIGLSGGSIMGQQARQPNDGAEISKVAMTKGNYAPVNGLKLIYESHSNDRPFVVFHGVWTTAELFHAPVQNSK